jgi:probable phosphoglycerate mutase
MNIQGENQNTAKSGNITTIYVVRHGESIGNLHHRCLGHTDLDITELGYKQAERTAECLETVDFAAVYSSDLIRAIHTAEPHAIKRRLEVIGMPDFRELYFGDWENASVSMLLEDFNEMFMIGWRKNFGTFTPPKGESVIAMAERMEQGLKKIASMHVGENILVASHAAAIRALWGKISGYVPSEWAEAYLFPTNASYSVIEYDGTSLKPVSYSNDSHLGELITYIKT